MRKKLSPGLKTKQNSKMASSRGRIDSFVWTDDEVELLLRVTLNYKTAKLQGCIDWESCQSKYVDIMDAFLEQYPSMAEAGKDFPHLIQNICKTQITSKIKSIRTKYRKALNTGRRRGLGRVVLLFFELCEEIWGRFPAATPISAGFETGDLAESSSPPSTAAASPAAMEPPFAVMEPPTSFAGMEPSTGFAVMEPPTGFAGMEPSTGFAGMESSTGFAGMEPSTGFKCEESEVNLDSHRAETLKRKPPPEPAELDDLQIKRRMLRIMEQSERRSAENLQQINTNIANSTRMIQESLSLMREVIQQRVKQIELKLL